MVDAGCDVIEVGLPYSDPVMDGPTIQAAAQQALDGGVRTADVLPRGRGGRRDRDPDPGDDLLEPRRAATASSGSPPTSPSAGGAGLITPDLTPDVGPDWIAAADAHDLDKVFLVAPSSHRRADRDDHGRLPRLRLRHRGHGRHRRPQATTATWPRPLVARTKATTDLPVGVGLGVSNGDQAAEVAAYADGVIVGSAFVRRCSTPATARRLRALTRADRGPGRGSTAWRRARRRLAGARRSLLLGALAACDSSAADDEDGDGYRAGQTHRRTRSPATPLTDTDGAAVLPGRRHRQGPHPGLLRLHALPGHLPDRDVEPRLRDDPARRRATASGSTWCS